MKRLILWICFFAVIALFIWGLASGMKTTVTGELTVLVSDTDWSMGMGSTTLVEYSDLQCPACRAYEPIVKAVVKEFPNDLHFVYRHFPLITLHKNADYAAAAAEAAGKQGKFWEMHDLLFEKQDEWATANDTKIFSEYAKSLELDIDKFERDSISIEVRKKINDSYKGGTSAGVQGTPTFFLNGKKIENPRSEEEFKALIKNAIATSTVSQ